ncbi:nucleoporin [Culex quinquefasciatus]|uniref:Nucleoporin n=1 Tax=Culex quinquefasciatus TaxID=7176 RepID=B0WT07_CULQU|nr:nucleoporin [Culex quinquefasciatus]|eukprot:XP_001870769.1 nucleoporin [Culex quinquefasciatus]
MSVLRVGWKSVSIEGGGSSSVFDAFKGFVGVTSTSAVKPTEAGASPFSLLSATIFATTHPSKKVVVGSRPKEETAGSIGKDTGDEEYAANVKALSVVVAAWISEKVKENLQQPNNLASGLARQVLHPERVSSLPTWPNPPRTASRTKRPPPMTTRTNRPRWSSRRSRTASFPSGANFVKADGNYSDRGIGTLYIKVNRKVQIMVLADSSIGQILLNIILNEAVPVQGMGKRNVMMVCLLTPETKPPSVLLWVEEADELRPIFLQMHCQRWTISRDRISSRSGNGSDRTRICPGCAGQVVSEQDDGMVEEYLAYVPITTNEQADQVDLEEAEMDGEYLAYVQIATNVPAGQVDSEQDELVENDEMVEEFLPRIPNAASGPVVQVVHEEEDIETTYYELECLADVPIDIELGGFPTVVNGTQVTIQHY